MSIYSSQKNSSIAIEMLKNLNGISPEITNDLFVQRTENRYNFRHLNDFSISHIITWDESLSYLRPKVQISF